MTQKLTVSCPFHVRQGRRGRKELRRGEPTPSPPPGRVPRVARLMALAIRYEQLLRDGVVENQAELARLGHVSRARLTQVMNLLNLAPTIQEEILFLQPLEKGRDLITERSLRSVAAEVAWEMQMEMWRCRRW